MDPIATLLGNVRVTGEGMVVFDRIPGHPSTSIEIFVAWPAISLPAVLNTCNFDAESVVDPVGAVSMMDFTLIVSKIVTGVPTTSSVDMSGRVSEYGIKFGATVL